MSDQDADFPTNIEEGCVQEDSLSLHIPLLPTLEFEPDAGLVAQGWERRYMADPDRIKEATRMYTELGFDVHIESIKPTELSEICGACRLATCHAYSTIYTRKRLKGNDEHKQE
ncbi:MAG: hypothetical protein GY943_39165 [Chloroflexi bacterium]|nr:hypothetical protein [Chloroflexota bacterium]